MSNVVRAGQLVGSTPDYWSDSGRTVRIFFGQTFNLENFHTFFPDNVAHAIPDTNFVTQKHFVCWVSMSRCRVLRQVDSRKEGRNMTRGKVVFTG